MAIHPVPGLVNTYASRLRFPRLLALTATLFVIDLAVPDFIPFIDEILLGLGTLVLANLRTRRNSEAPQDPANPPQLK
jgi:hypothetical protein